MATPRLTPETVFAAADKLVEQGQHPSVATVRDALGSGSFSTITKYLQQWREQQEKAAVTVDLPDKVEATYRKAAVAAWQEASRLASEQVATMEERMEQERQKHTREADEAATEIERLERLIQEMELKAQQRNKELEELRRENSVLVRDAASAEARCNSAAKEANTLNVKVDKLDAENRALIEQVGSLKAQLEAKQDGK